MALTTICRYSTIDANELMEKVLPDYAIETPLECLFWERGANDTYKVSCANNVYFLRVFRTGAYPRDANEFEAEALSYLHQQGFPVAYPIARKAGGYLTEVAAPEGPRYVLVSAIAQGSRPDYNSLDNCRLVGQSVAQLHTVSNGFKTPWVRTQLDLQGLLESPLGLIRSHFSQSPDVIRAIEKIAEELREAVQAVPESALSVGLCHGDLHGGNLHVYKGVVTHFDFEEAAFGYQLYDLATFKWGVCVGGDERRSKRWPAFLEGYEAVRRLTDAELALVNTFVVIREISETAYGIRHINDFGHNDIIASDLDKSLNRLKNLLDSGENSK